MGFFPCPFLLWRGFQAQTSKSAQRLRFRLNPQNFNFVVLALNQEYSNMFIIILVVSLILAYLLGSIPTAVWLGRSLHNIDVRDHGSGNAGATNTFRVLGAKAGLTVFLIDAFKGFLATSIPILLQKQELISLDENQFIIAQIITGLVAVIGHVFPVFANFKGGKGVATLLGMVLAINYLAALCCLGVFILVFAISRYVSLGSMLAAITFPILLLLPKFNADKNMVLIGFGIVISLLVVITHKKNIKRLLNGEENRINFKKG